MRGRSLWYLFDDRWFLLLTTPSRGATFPCGSSSVWGTLLGLRKQEDRALAGS